MTSEGALLSSGKKASAPSRLRSELATLRGAFNPRLSFFTAFLSLLPEFALVRVRAGLYRLAGLRLGAGVTVHGRLRLIGGQKNVTQITVGDGCILAPEVGFGLDAPITLGRNVALGPDVTLCTATHSLGFGSRRMNPRLETGAITIGDGAWVCVGALVLPGITIGPGAVVAAGSVVTEDVPPHTLVCGVPATVQQELPFKNR